jgi:hypothetical protein
MPFTDQPPSLPEIFITVQTSHLHLIVQVPQVPMADASLKRSAARDKKKKKEKPRRGKKIVISRNSYRKSEEY